MRIYSLVSNQVKCRRGRSDYSPDASGQCQLRHLNLCSHRANATSLLKLQDLMAVDLGKLALAGLLHRNPELKPADIDYVLYGTVIQESRTSNIAREVRRA